MANEQILAKLWETIQSRRTAPSGYIAESLQNPFKLRQKFIQEAYEVLEAHQARLARLETNVAEEPGAKGFGVKHHMTAEAVDVILHLYILLASIDVTPDDVYELMEQRFERWFPQPVAT
jgi:phosphoribosyl-ATP pyrophosphohydrolase